MNVAVVDMRSANAATAFVDALRDSGFAVLRHPPLDTARLARMNAGWRAFFASPERQDYLAVEDAESGNSTGYIPPEVSETAVGHADRDLKEFFQIMPGARLPPALAADVLDHMDEALALGRELLTYIDRDCGALLPPDLRGQLPQTLSAAHSLLRILHYPPLDGSEPAGAVRAAAHEDINLITLLPVSQEPGLQVRDREGRWLDVPGSPGDLIINAGDMLQELTAKALPSTTHRVVNPADSGGNVSRISMPYFLAPELDLRLSSRYTAGSYLRERLALLAR